MAPVPPLGYVTELNWRRHFSEPGDPIPLSLARQLIWQIKLYSILPQRYLLSLLSWDGISHLFANVFILFVFFRWKDQGVKNKWPKTGEQTGFWRALGWCLLWCAPPPSEISRATEQFYHQADVPRTYLSPPRFSQRTHEKCGESQHSFLHLEVDVMSGYEIMTCQFMVRRNHNPGISERQFSPDWTILLVDVKAIVLSPDFQFPSIVLYIMHLTTLCSFRIWTWIELGILKLSSRPSYVVNPMETYFWQIGCRLYF